MDCSKFVVYEKKLPVTRKRESKGDYTYLQDSKLLYRIIGLDADDQYIYKHISYNNFEKTKTKIPDGYKSVKYSNKWMQKNYCGTKTLLKKGKTMHKDFNMYKIHDNGGRPFIVYISKSQNKQLVYIYKLPDNTYFPYRKKRSCKIDKRYYTKLIKTYKVDKVFVGEHYGEMWGLPNSFFKGNSILLKIGKKYIFIGYVIMEFTPPEEIYKYYSNIGNNDVPYPVALGKQYVYFLIETSYYKKELFPPKQNMNDVHTELYKYYKNTKRCKEWIKKHQKKIKYKIIEERNFTYTI